MNFEGGDLGGKRIIGGCAGPLVLVLVLAVVVAVVVAVAAAGAGGVAPTRSRVKV